MKWLLPLLLFSTLVNGQPSIYFLDSLIPASSLPGCSIAPEELSHWKAQLEKDITWEDPPGYPEHLEKENFQLETFDLNQDGQCELMEAYSNHILSSRHIFYNIYRIGEDSLHKIWEGVARPFFQPAPEKNYRLVAPVYSGRRTNPAVHYEVYRYDGETYRPLDIREVTRGELMELGKAAYDEQDYATAEKYYATAYFMPRISEAHLLADAGNLALCRIKMGEEEEAIQLMKKHIAPMPDSEGQRMLFHNMGLAYFRVGKYKLAEEYLRAAYNYDQHKATGALLQKTVEKLEKK